VRLWLQLMSTFFVIITSPFAFGASNHAVSFESETKLSDGSTAFINPTYIYEGKQWAIESSDNGSATCMLLGFNDYVWRDSLYASVEVLPPGTPYVLLRSNGSIAYVGKASANPNHSIERLTAIQCKQTN